MEKEEKSNPKLQPTLWPRSGSSQLPYKFIFYHGKSYGYHTNSSITIGSQLLPYKNIFLQVEFNTLSLLPDFNIEYLLVTIQIHLLP